MGAKLRVMGPDKAGEALGREALQHVDALYAYAHYLTRDAQRAQDLVQETFARSLASARSFTPGTALKAWLFRIQRNVFLDQRRRETKSPVRGELDAEIVIGVSKDDADYDHLRGIVASEIEAALSALPEPQRSVVLLDLEGFSESEMADVLGCAPGTIKSRLARARAALRELLKEYAR
jgi:RNA polymerase sigma-70 factor (ECF subfamily)